MSIVFDTNVILDVLLKRQPFAAVAVRLVAAVERGELIGLVAATTVTTIYYLTAKALGEPRARREMGQLLTLFDVAPVNRRVLDLALQSDFEDFEDGVIHAAATQAGARGIVTRNEVDFVSATLPIYAPADLLRMLRAAKGDT